jgi:hypothetical protein
VSTSRSRSHVMYSPTLAASWKKREASTCWAIWAPVKQQQGAAVGSIKV